MKSTGHRTGLQPFLSFWNGYVDPYGDGTRRRDRSRGDEQTLLLEARTASWAAGSSALINGLLVQLVLLTTLVCVVPPADRYPHPRSRLDPGLLHHGESSASSCSRSCSTATGRCGAVHAGSCRWSQTFIGVDVVREEALAERLERGSVSARSSCWNAEPSTDRIVICCRGWAWLIQDQTMGPIGRALVDTAGQNNASTRGRA